ncbi:hypothetical protein GCM10027425_02890 [Alteromonas gracilis]
MAVAAAAPAYAASNCSTSFSYALNWPTGYTRTSALAGTASIAPSSGTGGTNVTMTLAAAAVGANVPDATRNLQVPADTGTPTTIDPVVTSLGGRAGERGIRLQQTSPAGRGNRQVLTLAFSRPVRGLTFFITDIDTITNPAYSDRVELIGRDAQGGTVAFNQIRDGITGDGTFESPWLRAADLNVPENNAGAQVQVTFGAATAVSSLELTYWSATGTTQYHRIFIGRMAFTALGC